MSLKSFHIVFVTICTLLCVFLLVWALVLAPEGAPLVTPLRFTGIAGLLLMPVYGVYFYRKAAKLVL